MPIPFAIPAIMAGAGLLGKLFGGGAQKSAENRSVENQNINSRNNLLAQLYGIRQGATTNALLAKDRGAMDRYQTRQGATTTALGQEEAGKLNRAELGLRAPDARARQSILGSLMENWSPVTMQNTNPRLAGRIPQISGGWNNPNLLSDTTRQHGRDLQAKALAAQFSGSDVPSATDFKSGILDAPEMTDFTAGILDSPTLSPYKNASGLEKFLGAGGLVGSVLGGIGELMNAVPRKTPVPFIDEDI